MSKSLAVAYIVFSNDKVHFRVVHQSHREREFSDGHCEIEDSHWWSFPTRAGVTLISCGEPEIRDHQLFLRGREKRYDSKILECRQNFFLSRLIPAILEYNRTFNKNRVEDEDVAVLVHNIDEWHETANKGWW